MLTLGQVEQFPFSSEITLEGYEEFATTLRRPDPLEDTDWRSRYADLIGGEEQEFLLQHGPVQIALEAGQHPFFPEDWPEEAKNLDEIRNYAKDELSDLLWFDIMSAHHLDENPTSLVAQALHKITGSAAIPKLTSFQDIQAAARASTSQIYATGQLSPNLKFSIAEKPIYVFYRLTEQLRDTLRSPARNNHTEIATAVGGHLLAVSYLADRLDIRLADLARYNAYKLVHRHLFGKIAGHFFS
jgi:hypothetical protein